MWNQLPQIGKFIISFIGAIGIYEGIKHIQKKKIFISFAIEDKKISYLLAGQSKNKISPFEFIDMSVKKPWDNSWKTKCRERIKDCHGMIVIITKHTPSAQGVIWEVNCAKQEGVPIMAIYANNNDRNYKLPNEFKGIHISNWSWDKINNFIKNTA